MFQPIIWLLLAAVHAAPALAVLRPVLLARLYGIAPADPAFVLIQHRAALFMCVMIACLWATFDPGVRRLAVLITAISVLSFLMLFALAGSPVALRGIAMVDLAAVPLLIAAGYLAYGAQPR